MLSDKDFAELAEALDWDAAERWQQQDVVPIIKELLRLRAENAELKERFRLAKSMLKEVSDDGLFYCCSAPLGYFHKADCTYGIASRVVFPEDWHGNPTDFKIEGHWADE